MKKIIPALLIGLLASVALFVGNSNAAVTTYAQAEPNRLAEVTTNVATNDWGFDICDKASGTIEQGEHLVFHVNKTDTARSDWNVKIWKNVRTGQWKALSFTVRFMANKAGDVVYNLTGTWEKHWADANTEVTKTFTVAPSGDSVTAEFQFGLIGGGTEAFDLTIYEITVGELDNYDLPLASNVTYELRNRTHEDGRPVTGSVNANNVNNGANFVTESFGTGDKHDWRYEFILRTGVAITSGNIYVIEYSVTSTSEIVGDGNKVNIVIGIDNQDGWIDKYDIKGHGNYDQEFSAGETKTYRNILIADRDASNIGVIIQAGRIENTGTVTIEDLEIYQISDKVLFNYESAAHFISDWAAARAAGTNGMCSYLTGADRAILEDFIDRYDTLLVTTNGFVNTNQKDVVANTIDVEGVTIATSVEYFRAVLAGQIATDGDYGIVQNNNNILKSVANNAPVVIIASVIALLSVISFVILKRKTR